MGGGDGGSQRDAEPERQPSTNVDADADAEPSTEGPSTEPIAGPSKADLRQFVSNQVNVNTKKKTDSCVSNFRLYLQKNHNIATEPESIDGDTLDTYLGDWLMQLKKEMVRIMSQTVSPHSIVACQDT